MPNPYWRLQSKGERAFIIALATIAGVAVAGALGAALLQLVATWAR